MSTTQRDTGPALRPAGARETAGLSPLPRVAVALGMSLLLWLYVASVPVRPVSTRYSSVPIEIRNPSNDLVLNGELPTVSVEVRAAPGTTEGANTGPPTAHIDLAGLTAGGHLVRVDVDAPDGGEVVSVQPPQVRVDLEPAQRETFPVQVGWSAAGRREGLDGAVARPAEATVVGTRRDVRRVAEVIADIATEEATPGVGQTAPLLALDADGRVLEGIRIEPAQVVVTLPPNATATP